MTLISVIRNIIQNFYNQQKRVSTIPKLLPIIKQNIHFHWGCQPLEKAVKNLGYEWRKYQSKRKILVARADTTDWR
jgi:hypothetical protein